MNLTILYWIDMLGIAVFAFSGVLAAGRKGLDWFGVMVIAGITAIGGGTLRDLLLDRHPLFWLTDPTYVWVIASTSLLTLMFLRYLPDQNRVRSSKKLYRTLLIADALGLALFCLQGAQIAQQAHLSWLAVIMLATLTGVGGGMLRDIFTNEIPLILRQDIYATAAIIGIAIYLWLPVLGLNHDLAFVVGMLSIVGIRISAIIWRLQVPRFHWQEH